MKKETEKEFVSDDELIGEEDIAEIIKPMRKTKKRPCANCTCGRKEEAQKTNSSISPVNSNCGNCSLGDAFRCAGCPFTGLPPFAQNKPVEFNPDEV